MRAKNLPSSILLALLTFAAGNVGAVEATAAGALPPFCVPEPRCAPQRPSNLGTEEGKKGADAVPKGELRIPKKTPPRACNSMAGGGCYFHQPADQWACCSHDPGEQKKPAK